MQITAANLELTNGAVLSAAAFGQGNAGDIILGIRERFLADDGSIETNAAFASGGRIIIDAGDILLKGDSDLQTFVNVGAGSGGDIEIAADTVIALDKLMCI